MEYKCNTKCYFRKREWKVGEVIVPEKGETLPGYFEPIKKEKVLVEVPEGTNPKTLSEATKINENLAKAAQGQFTEENINKSADKINTKRKNFLE